MKDSTITINAKELVRVGQVNVAFIALGKTYPDRLKELVRCRRAESQAAGLVPAPAQMKSLLHDLHRRLRLKHVRLLQAPPRRERGGCKR